MSRLTCRSFMGFQSCSTKMTVSAPVRLRPRPPTLGGGEGGEESHLVERSSRSMLGSVLNLETMAWRLAAGTEPSRRR